MTRHFEKGSEQYVVADEGAAKPGKLHGMAEKHPPRADPSSSRPEKYSNRRVDDCKTHATTHRNNRHDFDTEPRRYPIPSCSSGVDHAERAYSKEPSPA